MGNGSRDTAWVASGGGGGALRVVRGVGWTLIAAGLLVALYVVYLLFFTNLETNRVQDDLRDAWGALDADGFDPEAVEQSGEVMPGPGDAFAVLWFERDGDPIIVDDPLYVVQGVSVADLRRGPGWYPTHAHPGEVGNLAISGHRTTYGAPFHNIDQLQEGDTIHVMDLQRRTWVYEFREQRLVRPSDVWVIGEDPLGSGGAVMTLISCHPKFSAAQRIVVFADLVGEPLTMDSAASN